MSRSLNFVLAGSLWTVLSTVTIAYLDFPSGQLLGPALVMAGCIALTTLLHVASTLAPSLVGRHLATLLHLTIPLAWVTWLELTSVAWLGAQQWVLFAGCAFFGAALADQGVASAVESGPRTAQPLPVGRRATDSGAFPLAQLSAFDSGGFSVRQLSACDSGSFRAP
jgi:hypothetical protein